MSELMGEPQLPIEAEAAPAEPAPSGPSPEEWQEVQEMVGYMREILSQQQQAPEPEAAEGYPEIDPFDAQQLAAFVQQQVQQSIAPVMDWTYQQQMSEAEERALDIIEDEVATNGEFMLGEKAYAGVRALANNYFAEEAQRHGNTPRAAETALRRAATDWRTYEHELAQKAVEQHMNQLTNLSGAGREMPATATGTSQVVTEPGGDELSIVRKYGGFPGVPG